VLHQHIRANRSIRKNGASQHISLEPPLSRAYIGFVLQCSITSSPRQTPIQFWFQPGLPIGDTQMSPKQKATETSAPAPVPAAAAPKVASEVAAPKVAAEVVPPVDALVTDTKASQPNLKDSIAKATAGIETTTVHAKQGMEKVMKTAEEFVAFGQGNVDAIVKSSQIWAAGVQDLTKQVAATAQAQFDETMSVFKALTSVKYLKDAFELQSSFARAALEKSVTESSRLTDASLKLTEQAMAPITARVTTAVESFSKAA
jgi:phasin family protein